MLKDILLNSEGIAVLSWYIMFLGLPVLLMRNGFKKYIAVLSVAVSLSFASLFTVTMYGGGFEGVGSLFLIVLIYVFAVGFTIFHEYLYY